MAALGTLVHENPSALAVAANLQVNPKPESRIPNPESRIPRPETRDPKPETLYPKL